MVDIQADAGPLSVISRLQDATNRHDLQAMGECFAVDYESEQPFHPDRTFRGRQQMIENWTQIFAGVPDLTMTALRSAVDGNTVWNEWEWSGTRRDGMPHVMRGVTIQGIEGGVITWVRLYIEPVVEGAGINASVREHVRGGSSA